MLKEVYLLCIWRTTIKQNVFADTFTKNTFHSVGKRFSVCDFSYRGIVTSEGTQWDLKLGAVHLMFPSGAVSEPTSIVVHRWKCSACSPQLQEDEAVVSRVIEISTNNYEPWFSLTAFYRKLDEICVKRRSVTPLFLQNDKR